MERGREQDLAVFKAWRYWHFFEFDLVKGDKNSVCCTLCVGSKLLTTVKDSTSNLSKQLASRHRNVKLTEENLDPPTDMTAVATTSNSTGWTSKGPSPATQVKIATGLSTAELKKLVAGYIVEDMLPGWEFRHFRGKAIWPSLFFFFRGTKATWQGTKAIE